MHEPLIKRARECRFFRGALTDLAVELPAGDAALDRLLEETVARKEDAAFTHLVLAALGTGRRVDARHLAGGAALFPEPGQLIAAALHMSGDVPRALIEAVANGRMGNEREATALLLAGIWCKDKAKQPLPADLIPRARILARRIGDNLLAQLSLLALAKLVQDDGFSAVLRSSAPALRNLLPADFIERMIQPARDSALGFVPEQPGPVVRSGYTVRRAVARVGRNDPCPCGSGKKYKKCCLDQDLERLQNSSSVPGLTVEELREQQERFLTRDQLLEMRSYELARLDPVKVADSLKPILINRLHLFDENEAVVQLFEKIGVPEALEGHWEDAIDNTTRASRKDLLLRLLKLREGQGSPPMDRPLATRLLLADEGDSSTLKLIEGAALEGLKDPDSETTVELAYALLEGPCPALGILVARGLVSTASLFEADMLFQSLLEARDKLSLSPDDPLQPLVDRRYRESVDEFRDSKALQDAHARLEAKGREVSQMRTELAELRRELERIERKNAKQAVTPGLIPSAVAVAVDEAAFDDLRRRAAVLKEELKDRHSERNQLRRDLRAALENLEALQQKNPAQADPAKEVSEDNEEGWLGAEEDWGIQPVRIPEFPKKFSESVQSIPQTVVRRALILIGRLASGDEGAFSGVKRLKSIREIYRQRVGADHRLLFRLHPAGVEVVALINRRDLDRKIKSLTT